MNNVKFLFDLSYGMLVVQTGKGGHSNMKYIVRPYRRGEEQYVADAHCRLYPAEYGWGPAFTEYAAKIAVDFAGAQQEGEALWVAECGGRLIGSVMLCQRGEAGEGQVRLFCVEPDYRRCGVGSALMKTVLDKAKELGCTRLMLWSAEPLTDAIRLYERAGFHITERVKNTEWRPDGDLVYEIKMVKECL